MKPKVGSKSNFRSDAPCQGVQRAKMAPRLPLRGQKAEVAFLPSKGAVFGFMLLPIAGVEGTGSTYPDDSQRDDD